jgi:hypothetical protein
MTNAVVKTRADYRVPYDDPHWMGGIGMIGPKPVYNAVMSGDLLLMVGTDYPYSNFLPPGRGGDRGASRGARPLRPDCARHAWLGTGPSGVRHFVTRSATVTEKIGAGAGALVIVEARDVERDPTAWLH